MAEPNHDNLDPELEDVARLLREQRSLPDPDVLERTRLRARSQARRRGTTATWTRTRKGEILRSRATITALLVLGIMMMATSSGIAVSGLAGDGSAGTAQYRTLEPGTEGGVAPGAETLGERGSGEGVEGEPDEGEVQGARQVGASDDSADSLPFTGFAAIVLLAGGLTLLTAGLVLRRSTRRDVA